ncbi:Uma2 family endonuclease [Ferruginibacter paludis]|uniref:Uma2 family endonuclease n=1 Tax=Ferruginibacter paludis TaxID=1310417 RepID=UPI0025B4DD6A|nr:Uma2 family endonuclease [Ferruginibacter paludis]MDN3658049.1 Uma2 family endonuclease [Ferruginibacter paludis]
MNTILHPPKTIYDVWESLPEGTLCQLINNNLIMSPSPLDVHQAVLNDINIALAVYVKKNKLGKVRIAPYDVHFSKSNIFQPDLIFISNDNLHLIEANGLKGAPDIAIEVLSPGNKHIDLGEKKDVYEQYGVKEYFIVHPDTKLVQSFILKNKKFEEKQTATGSIVSDLLQTTITF